MSENKETYETSKKTDLWNKVKTPPQEVLKQIGGGRLKGMTDIQKPLHFYLTPILIGDTLWL
jgi:hypothetical protein